MGAGDLTILALDCATTGCAVSVAQGDRILAHDAREMARGQAEVLLPMVLAALQSAGVKPDGLGAIAVTRGPGAFTGMRIGLAAARGLALSLGVPCLGVTTLEAVCAGVADSERQGRVILAAIESKRADIYVQFFDQALNPICAPTAADASALAAMVERNWDVVAVGDAAVRARAMLEEHGITAHLSTASALPDTRLVAAIALQRFDKNAAPPEPLYLRPPDAKPALNQGRDRT